MTVVLERSCRMVRNLYSAKAKSRASGPFVASPTRLSTLLYRFSLLIALCTSFSVLSAHIPKKHGNGKNERPFNRNRSPLPTHIACNAEPEDSRTRF
jgi:hypothetical protein